MKLSPEQLRRLSPVFFSSRHLPVWLRDVMHVLAHHAGHRGQLWRVHNRALRLGLAVMWREAQLGPWPDPRGRGALPRDMRGAQSGRIADDIAERTAGAVRGGVRPAWPAPEPGDDEEL